MDQIETANIAKTTEHCADPLSCEECRARVRALDATRYTWATPERLEWLRDELYSIHDERLFRRGKRGRCTEQDVLVVHAVPPRPFLPPHMSMTSVRMMRTASAPQFYPHPAADFLRDDARTNRVLVLWGSGALSAHELPEAEGGIGFTVLVADPAWLAADTARTN